MFFTKALLHAFKPANSSRQYLDAFARRAGNAVIPGARVLDVGAGDAPYRNYFPHAVYETADFCKIDKPYADITYICDLRSLPVGNEQYDHVLMTQVIEHLPEPLAVLVEINRVLKPGGCLWLSGPLYYQEHEQPYDFYRYTQFGLRYILHAAGFDVEEVEWLEGYCGTVSHQLFLAMKDLPCSPFAHGGGFRGVLSGGIVLISKPLLLFLSLILSRSDLRKRWTGSGHCKNYLVLAVKPSDQPSASRGRASNLS